MMVGSVDRMIRWVVGLGIFGYGVMAMNAWIIGLGGVVLSTAAAGFCLPYFLFGFSTGKKES